MIIVAKKNRKLREWKRAVQKEGATAPQMPEFLSGWSDFCKKRETENDVDAAQKWLATGGAWPRTTREHKTHKKKKEKPVTLPWENVDSICMQASWGWMPA